MAQSTVKKHLLYASLATLLSGSLSTVGFAAGFQLSAEDSASNLATYGAGGAAAAEDATTGFTNPAGLTRIKNKQIVLSAVGVAARTKFDGKVDLERQITPSPNSGTAKGNTFNVIPAVHVATPINDRIVLGFNVTVPFGLATDYDKYAFTRYAATKSEIQTINISPSIGIKLTDQLSIGAGVGAQHMEATLNSVVKVTVPSIGRSADFTVENKGSDWGYSWHIGALYEFTPTTRVGISHRSQVKHTLKGTSIFKYLQGDILPFPQEIKTNNLRADVTLPSTTSVSAYHELNTQWALMGTASFTRWSVLNTIKLHNIATPLGPVTSELPQNFRNTWRFALGTQYRHDERWLFRAGIGYDQNPTRDKERSIRLPDSNRIAVSLGMQYRPTKQLAIDVGYMHLFMKDAKINHTISSETERVKVQGTSKNATDLFGLQLTWDIDAI